MLHSNMMVLMKIFLKKLKEKEPFYASVFERNVLKSGKKVKINNFTLGIELEVCYFINKSFFTSKGIVTKKNVTKSDRT